MVCWVRVILLFVLVDIAIAAVFNGSFLEDLENDIKTHKVKTRRQSKNKKGRSTSSSSGGIQQSGGGSSNRQQSLEISESESVDSDKQKKKTPKKNGAPKSSKERRGWRKWHRKCTPCPDDMRLKWKDPRIKWICGSYQLARRSFKSLCMMHYRNCQDGTMFTKMADHRCKNSTHRDLLTQGEHFMYDYDVVISDQASKSKSKSESELSSEQSSSAESWNSDKYGSRHADSQQFKDRMNMIHVKGEA